VKVRALLLSLAVSACGPTIGDPCTTAQDCLGRTCLNGGGVPGGYCSSMCKVGDMGAQCPTGTVCIRDGIANGNDGCYRQCNSTRDCRTGYRCESARGSDATVCVGPNGL
jgi:hypothetical protein